MFSLGMPTPVSETLMVTVSGSSLRSMVSAAAVGHGVLRVGEEVGEHLHHLIGVDVGDRVGQVVLRPSP